MLADLAVSLAGDAQPLRGGLAGLPTLAGRFPTIIGFPGYDPAQLAAIFATLATEAGFTLAPAGYACCVVILILAAGLSFHAVQVTGPAASSGSG